MPYCPHPGPVDVHAGQEVLGCNISSNTGFADVAKCNKECYGEPTCKAFVMQSGTCYLKSCTHPIQPNPHANSSILTGPRYKPPTPPAYCDPSVVEPLQQVSVRVDPTITRFVLADSARTFLLNVSFVSSMFAEDYARLSRPVYFVDLSIQLQSSMWEDGTAATAYFDMSAQHVVNEDAEPVGWSTFSAGSGVSGVTMGTAAQCVLCTKGDKTNINWGHLYLGTVQDARHAGLNNGAWAGTAQSARLSFVNGGSLPASPDGRQPRSSDDDMPAVCATISLDVGGSTPATIVVAYDDAASVRYYGTAFKAWWTTVWPTIQHAIQNATAPGELAHARQQGNVADSSSYAGKLMLELATVGCTGTRAPVLDCEYALIGALAYRQTLAATKLTINNATGSVGEGKMWNFLKEISTNGDMQTMDVVYPASPMLLYSNPELLRLLLVPVLNFANNGTDTPFTNPFSPHQIGTYPIADATTGSQEPMPMENTGNMFLMLAGITQRQHDAAWLKPYMRMLTTWAEYLIASLPFPANQLCTDDFTGRLANNTNLAAKGIVALEAFSHICTAAGGTNCDRYSSAARGFAPTWSEYALEQKPKPHYKIAYNFPNSYSIKYNLVWQKLLNYSGPFPWKQVVAETEVPYYLSHANAYGPPMDSRHTYVKYVQDTMRLLLLF